MLSTRPRSDGNNKEIEINNESSRAATYGWHTITYEWHTNDIRIHTSDIRMAYEYIRVIYGWHTSTYDWHTDDIRVHMIDIRMTCVSKEKRFKTFLIILFQNIRFVKEFLACNGCYGLFAKIEKGSGVWCTFSAWFFHKKCSLSNTISVDKVPMSYLFSFSRYQKKRVIKFLFRQLMTS